MANTQVTSDKGTKVDSAVSIVLVGGYTVEQLENFRDELIADFCREAKSRNHPDAKPTTLENMSQERLAEHLSVVHKILSSRADGTSVTLARPDVIAVSNELHKPVALALVDEGLKVDPIRFEYNCAIHTEQGMARDIGKDLGYQVNFK